MDILTQGLLGGVLAQSVARDNEKKIATLAGIGAGLLADADILISSASDPLLNIEYHRHFTHSLIFIPVGAAIAMMLLWPLLRNRISTRRLYLFCLLGYSMSGLLDACTSYGTHLLWPFSDQRVAFNIISIVDPVFTLVLLSTLILGYRVQGRRLVYAGLGLSLAYLALGAVQQQRAVTLALSLADSRKHSVSQYVVKPTMANIVLWRSVYIADGRIYIDAIRTGLPGDNRVIEGDSVELFSLERDLPDLDKSSTLYRDIERFIVFSDGYVAFDPARNNTLGDIRYSMLPVSAKPLWGISIDTGQPQQHPQYQFFRDSGAEVRQAFFQLLFTPATGLTNSTHEHALPVIH